LHLYCTSFPRLVRPSNPATFTVQLLRFHMKVARITGGDVPYGAVFHCQTLWIKEGLGSMKSVERTKILRYQTSWIVELTNVQTSFPIHKCILWRKMYISSCSLNLWLIRISWRLKFRVISDVQAHLIMETVCIFLFTKFVSDLDWLHTKIQVHFRSRNLWWLGLVADGSTSNPEV
jgi:hypothetical protein